MFNKKKSALPPQSPAAPLPPPTPPPRFVRYDRNEKREYVLNIVEVRPPKDGTMQVRLVDQPDWVTLYKAVIDVRAVLNEFTYNAVFFNRSFSGEKAARYLSGMKCQLTLRGPSGRSPLIAFPPFEQKDTSESLKDDTGFGLDEEDEADAEPTAEEREWAQEHNELYTTWGIYSAVFSDVAVGSGGGGEPDEAEEARPPIKLWDTEKEADEAQNRLLAERKAVVAGDKKHIVAWPTCILNTNKRFMTPRWDEPDITSYLSLPSVVFDGLRRDVVEMGPRLRVEALLTIEAYVLNRGQNFGYGEFDDHRHNFDLALIPHDSVLSADLQRLEVKWREGGSISRAETREERMEEAAPPLDASSSKQRGADE